MVNVSDVTVYISAYSGPGAVGEDDVINGTGAGFLTRAVLTDAISRTSYDFGTGGGGEGALANGSTNYFWSIAADSAGNRSALRGPVEGVTVDTLAPGVTGPGVAQDPSAYLFAVTQGTVEENATTDVKLWLLLATSIHGLTAIQAINGGDLDGALEAGSVDTVTHPGNSVSVPIPALTATRYYDGSAFAGIVETTPDLYGHIIAEDGSGEVSRTVFGPYVVQDKTPPSGQVYVEKSLYPTTTLSFRYIDDLVDFGSGMGGVSVIYSLVDDPDAGTEVVVTGEERRDFAVSATGTFYCFVRATDVAGNEIVLSTHPASIREIVLANLRMLLDANNPNSYPGTGTAWLDGQGNGNDADIASGASYVIDDTFGNYFNFTGSADGILPSVMLPATADFTLEVVFRTTSLSTFQILYSAYPNATAIGRLNYVVFGSPQQILLFVGTTSSNGQFVGKAGVTSNTWFHSVVRKTNNVYQLFLNNQGSGTLPLSTPIVQTQNCIGDDQDMTFSSRKFFGDIAIVKYYDRALGDAELTQNFDAVRGRFGISS